MDTNYANRFEENEYFMSPEKNVFEVRTATFPEDPNDYLLSHIITADTGNEDEIKEKYARVLEKLVPWRVQTKAYEVYLKERCFLDTITEDGQDKTNNSTTYFLRVQKESDDVFPFNSLDCLFPFSSSDCTFDVTGDIQKDAAKITMDFKYQLKCEGHVSLYDLQKDAAVRPLFSDYVIFSDIQSPPDSDICYGAYLVMDEVENEYGPGDVSGKSILETEIGLYDCILKKDVYSITEYGHNGELIDPDVKYECCGRESVFSKLPEGSVSLGLYRDITECFEKNQRTLGIHVSPLLSLDERVSIADEEANAFNMSNHHKSGNKEKEYAI